MRWADRVSQRFEGADTNAGTCPHLTIDEMVQYIAEKELEEAVSHSHAKAGPIIVMRRQRRDPRDGGQSAFDPNAVAALTADRWRNRALTDTYAPGRR